MILVTVRDSCAAEFRCSGYDVGLLEHVLEVHGLLRCQLVRHGNYNLMNELIKLKRDQFRVHIRNQEINKVFAENRKHVLQPIQENSLKVLEYAQQLDYKFTDLNQLNIFLEGVFRNWHSMKWEMVLASIELVGSLFMLDLQVPWLQPSDIEMTFLILKQHFSDMDAIDSIIKLYVNSSYYHDWICQKLLDLGMIQICVKLINETTRSDIMLNLLKLIGNLLVDNSQGQVQFLEKENFLLIGSHIKEQAHIIEFIRVIKNLTLTEISVIQFKMIIHYWIGLIDPPFVIKEEFYSLLQALTFDFPAQWYHILLENGLIERAVQDLQSRTYCSENLINFILNLTYMEYDHTIFLVNCGILQALKIRLDCDLVIINVIYTIISNVLSYSDIFDQACIIGLVAQLGIKMGEYIQEHEVQKLSQVIQCIHTCVENYGKYCGHELSLKNIDDQLVNFIQSDLTDYSTEETLMAIEILHHIWSILPKHSIISRQLESKLNKLLLADPLHMKTEKLLILIESILNEQM